MIGRLLCWLGFHRWAVGFALKGPSAMQWKRDYLALAAMIDAILKE